MLSHFLPSHEEAPSCVADLVVSSRYLVALLTRLKQAKEQEKGNLSQERNLLANGDAASRATLGAPEGADAAGGKVKPWLCDASAMPSSSSVDWWRALLLTPDSPPRLACPSHLLLSATDDASQHHAGIPALC